MNQANSDVERNNLSRICFALAALLVAVLAPMNAYASSGPYFSVEILIAAIVILLLLIWTFVGTAKQIKGSAGFKFKLGLVSLVLSVFVVWFALYVLGSLSSTVENGTHNGVVTISVYLVTPIVLLLMPKFICTIVTNW